MNSKKGISKIALIIIILVVIIIIAVGTFLTIWLIQRNNAPTEEVELYEEYVEGEGFVGDEDLEGEEMTPLEDGLKEYRNDELGIRFGYLEDLPLPVDVETEDGTYVSTMENDENNTAVVLRVGKIDVSQGDIDHIEKQKEALTQELIRAETVVVEEEVDGKMVERTIVPEKVSDIETSYSLLADQLAVRFTYTENGLQATRILTIKDNYVFSLTYKAEPDNYRKSDEDKVFNSFDFITKIDETEKTELNTVYINDKEYTLPIRQTQMEGLTIDSKYATQKLNPNYFTIVSLYEAQQPKYSAYVYNAKASIDDIGEGYVTAISTDVNRGGNIRIYKGIELGTTYSKVSELLGSPARQYLSDDKTLLTNIYQIEGVTIQLRFRNDDLSENPDDNSKVVSILLKVAR